MTIVTARLTAAVVPVVALALGTSLLVYGRRAVSQTTLVGAWWWALAALVGWSGVELYAALMPLSAAEGRLAPARLTAITLSLCPVVAVLGAKRPQHTAWQFVAVTLWGILALPAAEAFFLHRGQQVEVGDARAWLLWIVILLGPINYVPTRQAAASLAVAAGQALALSPYLALIHRALVPRAEAIGLAICVLGLATAWLSPRSAQQWANTCDRMWLDFRNAFGLFWGLRIQERVNAAAEQNGWNVELRWNGLRHKGDADARREIDPAIESELRSMLKGLLRRFVSSEWIAGRMPVDSGKAAEIKD